MISLNKTFGIGNGLIEAAFLVACLCIVYLLRHQRGPVIDLEVVKESLKDTEIRSFLFAVAGCCSIIASQDEVCGVLLSAF